MRVAIVINSLSHRAGAQTFFYNLCKQLLKDNSVELFIISLYSNIDSSFSDIKKFNFYTCGKKRKIDFKAALKFKKIIKKIKPDIINFHLGCFVTYCLAFGLRKRKWELIKTYHSIPGKDLNKINLWLEEKLVKRKNLSFIGISTSISQMSKLLYENAPCATIFNGIPINNCCYYRENKKYDFIIVASFEDVKNHRLLFDAAKRVLETRAIKIACIGNGTLFNDMISYCSSIGIKNHVYFLGAKNDVFDYLNESRVFILTSKREGNPITILEAMSCGLPIIAPMVGGIPDVVKKENGILFKDYSSVVVSECMNTMLNSDLKSYYFNNIEAVKEYSIERTAGLYCDFFRKVFYNERKKL